MKISFVNATLGGDYSALDIAITTLASYVNARSSHQADIIDLTFHRRKWKKFLRAEIMRKKPDIIGISTNTMYMQYVRAVMTEIKQQYDLPIILGGHHASIYPTETMSLAECDYVAIGDGEDLLVNFLEHFDLKKSMRNVTGIWAKEQGALIQNEKGCFRACLDDLPLLDWRLWDDLDRYFYFLGMLYVIGSRGCPYRCTYCDARGIADALGGTYFRLKDPIIYARELVEYGAKYRHQHLKLLQVFDPVFTMNHPWLERFCSEYKKGAADTTLPFSVFSRIDHLNADSIRMLAEARCRIVRVGIETGDECIRHNIYNKKINDKNIEDIFSLLKKYGISSTAYYILGGPNESRQSLCKTLTLARKLEAERSAFFIYKPFTEEGRQQIVEYGGRIDQKKWAQADNITFQAVIYLHDLTPFDVEKFQVRSYFFTFGKRLIKIVKRQKWCYPLWFMSYMIRGIWHGLSVWYLLIYFHIYGYDNVDK